MATTYLQRTNTTPTQLKKYTVSIWFKKGLNATSQYIYSNYQDSNNRAYITFLNNDKIYVYDKEGGTDRLEMTSNFVCRDVNAWYHIVYAVDYRGNGASGAFTDRVKFYVNGVNRTADFTVASSFGYNSNTSFQIGTTSNKHNIGCGDSGQLTFDGSMSHVNFVDGTQLDASAFGETDTTTGEWKIKTSPTVSEYGNNGYFILKDSNSVTDQSGKGNNFTVGAGTLTKTEDCPSNVFATMNPLSKGSLVLSLGNTKARNDQSGVDANVLGTIALGNGKYYWENYKHGGGNTGTGLTLSSVNGGNHSAVHGSRVNYYQDGYIYQNGFGLSDINTGVSYGDTDIIGVSVDTENGTIKFYKNGALVNNSSQTNSVFTFAQNELIPFWYCNNGGEWRTNFGNGYFGTTAVSSAGTNASGNGIFEYDVQPTDATALSTKGLNL